MQVGGCNSSSCELSIPHDASYTYFIRTTDVSERYASLSIASWSERVASRLLLQATYGPTRSKVASLSLVLQTEGSSRVGELQPSPAIARYVRDQMAAEPTLHRSYLRRRANPRLDILTEVCSSYHIRLTHVSIS